MTNAQYLPNAHVEDRREVLADERAARRALRTQITRLERELSAVLATGFPHLRMASASHGERRGPRLLTLGELELERDRLVIAVQQAHRRLAYRRAQEDRSRKLLARMRLEPGRYKFAHVSVRDLGEGNCGVWRVRPRLGLIGMLAGWWQLTLSSGCPLARGLQTVCSPGARNPSQRRGSGCHQRPRAGQRRLG
jgi:hypothetical protein